MLSAFKPSFLNAPCCQVSDRTWKYCKHAANMRILMEENFICLLSQIPDTEQRIKDLSYKQPASCRVRPHRQQHNHAHHEVLLS